MARPKKPQTNEQAFRALFKDLSTHDVAMLRERVLKIVEITEDDITNHPENWEGKLFGPHIYDNLFAKVKEHLGFDKL